MTGAPAPQTKAKTERIPSLDGLRAVSITLVILSHLGGNQNFPLSYHQTNGYIEVGALGVRVFLVISGFLITRLLLSEVEQTGRISLKQFYIRRVFRIFPAYFFYLLFVFIGISLGLMKGLTREVGYAAIFLTDYINAQTWLVGHTWSLSVEEQFYLLWPLTLALLATRRAAWVAAAVILIAPLVRVAEAVFVPDSMSIAHNIGHTFETLADSLAVGCLLAIMRDRLYALPWYRALLDSRSMILVPVAVLAAFSLNRHGGSHSLLGLYLLVGFSITNVGIAIMIDWSVRNAHGRIGRLLNSRLLVGVGVMSYSMYLWQQPFLDRSSHAPLTAFPLNVACTLIAAALSYRLIEKPALRLRARLFARENSVVA